MIQFKTQDGGFEPDMYLKAYLPIVSSRMLFFGFRGVLRCMLTVRSELNVDVVGFSLLSFKSGLSRSLNDLM